MRIITNEELKKAARKYYDEGRLCAQNMEKVANGLAATTLDNEIDFDIRCAVGAAMTEVEILNAGEYYHPKTLMETNVVDFQDLSYACTLQDWHDYWYNTGDPEYEQAFLTCLNS